MNRNFLVTGGAQGIGLAISRNILTGGGKVFFTDINEIQGEKAREDLAKEFGKDRVGFAKQDVTDATAWPTLWDTADAFFSPRKVEALVNNAGIFNKDAWQSMLDINMSGLVKGTMHAVERMGASRGGPGGLIVQIASAASFVCGFPTVEESLYSATKHGVLGLVRSLSVENCYKVEKIRMVGICPTFVDTKLVHDHLGGVPWETAAAKYDNLKLLKAGEVAAAFQQAVVGAESGQMLVILPGFCFYWPDWNRRMLTVFGMICTLYIKVLGQPCTEPVTPAQMKSLALFFFFVLCLLVHFFLSYLGL